jgi:hypothetical protein
VGLSSALVASIFVTLWGGDIVGFLAVIGCAFCAAQGC